MSTLSKLEKFSDKHFKSRTFWGAFIGVTLPLAYFLFIAYSMMHPSAENYSIPAPTSTIPDEVFSQRQLISIGTDGIYSGIPKLTTVFPYPCSALPKPNVLYAVIRNNHVKLFYRSDYFYESDLKEDNNMDLIHYVKPTELSLDAIYGPKVDVRLEDSFIRGWIRAGDCRWVIELSRETHPF